MKYSVPGDDFGGGTDLVVTVLVLTSEPLELLMMSLPGYFPLKMILREHWIGTPGGGYGYSGFTRRVKWRQPSLGQPVEHTL